MAYMIINDSNMFLVTNATLIFVVAVVHAVSVIIFALLIHAFIATVAVRFCCNEVVAIIIAVLTIVLILVLP